MPTQNLPVRLTTGELLTRADELGKAIQKRDDHVAAAKSAASTAPAQELAELRVRCRHLGSEQERLFAEEKLIRARLGAQPHETTIGALERLMAGLG